MANGSYSLLDDDNKIKYIYSYIHHKRNEYAE